MIDQYISHLNLNPYTFFGVNHTPQTYRANQIWLREERMSLQNALDVAQLDLEKMLGFELKPNYHSVEPHPYTINVFRTKYPYILNLGKQVVVELEDVEVNYDEEPASVSLETDQPDDIYLFHPVTLKEIKPLERTYVEPTLTLTIPRYLLVKDDNNPAEGWAYADLTKFVEDVSVKQISYNESQALQNEKSLLLIDAPGGLVQLETGFVPNAKLYLNYRSGWETLDAHTRAILIGYTHTKIPIPPVEDPVVKLTWLWDRDIPQNMSSAQRECPLGPFTAAYNTFRFATLNRVHRTSPL